MVQAELEDDVPEEYNVDEDVKLELSGSDDEEEAASEEEVSGKALPDEYVSEELEELEEESAKLVEELRLEALPAEEEIGALLERRGSEGIG